MNASELKCRLNLPSETLAAMDTLALPENHHQLKELFFRDPAAFRDYVSKNLTGLEILQLYLHWLPDTKTVYDKIGIPEDYYWSSLQDIRIWCEDYLTRFGSPGFIEWDWVGKTLRLEVIRVGRLQFEPATLSRPLTLSGTTLPAGTAVLHVHIPAGVPLDIGNVLESLAQAPIFYKKYFDMDFSIFHCHSWLLSPNLKDLLNSNSRIWQFQNLFEVYETDGERQAEERVFGFLSDDPNTYPENTSLQRAIKQYMLEGNTVEMGAGVRFIEPQG